MENEIKEEAYKIYEYRLYNNIAGDQLSDWYQAEKTVNDRYEEAFNPYYRKFYQRRIE